MPLLEQVLNKNPKTVQLVFKNFPLTSIHKMAKQAAIAALAAGKQDKFWEFHDSLFAEKKISSATIDKIVEKLALDKERFDKDLHAQDIVKLIEKDIKEAQKLGIRGTPAVFINGRKLQQRSLAGFQRMIDEEVQQSKQQ